MTLLNCTLFVPPATEYPSLPRSDNGFLSYTEGNIIFNSFSCQHKCYLGYLTIGSLPCGASGAWNVTRSTCASNLLIYIIGIIIWWHYCTTKGSDLMRHLLCFADYKLFLLIPFGGGALSTICCIGFCCLKHRRSECSSISMHGWNCAAVVMICHSSLQERNLRRPGQCWNLIECGPTHASTFINWKVDLQKCWKAVKSNLKLINESVSLSQAVWRIYNWMHLREKKDDELYAVIIFTP